MKLTVIFMKVRVKIHFDIYKNEDFMAKRIFKVISVRFESQNAKIRSLFLERY